MAGYHVDIYVVGTKVDVIGQWPYTPQLTYHVTGYLSRAGNWVPARDPVGLTPYAGDLIMSALEEWITKTFGTEENV